MKFNRLSHSGALTGGADIWILPEPPLSQWAASIDWQLNLQWARFSKKKLRQLPGGLKKWLAQENLEVPEPPARPLRKTIIESMGALPTKACLFLECQTEGEKWLSHVSDSISLLKPSQARVFLPKGLSFENAIHQGLNSDHWSSHPLGLVEESLFTAH